MTRSPSVVYELEASEELAEDEADVDENEEEIVLTTSFRNSDRSGLAAFNGG